MGSTHTPLWLLATVTKAEAKTDCDLNRRVVLIGAL
jgi:hypothetical protein